MGKNSKKSRSSVPDESHLILPLHQSTDPIVDTHTHIASTFASYRSKYPEGNYTTVFSFFRAMTEGRNVQAVVDVWCEAPVQGIWKEFADSAVTEEGRRENWGGADYWFVMGVHPHEAKLYNDQVEADILEAMKHPRCVGWGEMGLDYHYDNSPREIQQEVFIRQLRHATRLGKPLTIHTREAEEDTERILIAEVPKDHKVHIHCFTDSPAFADRLLSHFENLHIGLTGVVTYSTNENTPTTISQMVTKLETPSKPLRILLETDAPYMIPSNLYASFPTAEPAPVAVKPPKKKKPRKGADVDSTDATPVETPPESGTVTPEVALPEEPTTTTPLWPKNGKLPICHTAMIPWTAEFVAGIAGDGWDAGRVLRAGREGARNVYGI